MQFSFIFALIVSILIAIFAVQNADSVQIDLFFATFNISQAVVILVSTAIGAVVAAILGSIRMLKGRSGIKELKNKIKTLESEKSQLNESLNVKNGDIEALQNQKNEYKENCDKLAIELNDKKQVINDLQSSLQNYKSKETDIESNKDNVSSDAYLADNNEESKA